MHIDVKKKKEPGLWLPFRQGYVGSGLNWPAQWLPGSPQIVTLYNQLCKLYQSSSTSSSHTRSAGAAMLAKVVFQTITTYIFTNPLNKHQNLRCDKPSLLVTLRMKSLPTSGGVATRMVRASWTPLNWLCTSLQPFYPVFADFCSRFFSRWPHVINPANSTVLCLASWVQW